MDTRDPRLPAACRAIASDLFEFAAGPSADSSSSGELQAPESTRVPGSSQALEQHLASCAPCAARLLRARAHIEALGRLPRLDVPNELDGHVVAALQAGHRQVRATDVLSTLRRQAVPEELSQGDWVRPVEPATLEAKTSLVRRPVPSVLDRLVDESLRDLPGSVSSGLLGRLPRQRAPQSLDARVEAMLTSGEFQRSERRGVLALVAGGRLRRAWVALPAGIAAAAVLFVLARPMMGPKPGDDYPFEVVRRDAFDPSQHSKFTLDLLESLSGHPDLQSM
tara:strand:+ start:26311 stop:27150 length:840 start_codon:yes stop_codon:yes gene_type:complete